MTDKTKKIDGPTCACGKVDLYEEMIKNQNNKEEASDSVKIDQEDKDNISTVDSNGEDQKQTEN